MHCLRALRVAVLGGSLYPPSMYHLGQPVELVYTKPVYWACVLRPCVLKPAYSSPHTLYTLPRRARREWRASTKRPSTAWGEPPWGASGRLQQGLRRRKPWRLRKGGKIESIPFGRMAREVKEEGQGRQWCGGRGHTLHRLGPTQIGQERGGQEGRSGHHTTPGGWPADGPDNASTSEGTRGPSMPRF